jgi:predicted pyridoxine 5'-phosphate oxidase superfamily flavin-nucleotide-binding protein
MSSWTDVTTAAPELADHARARVESTGLALLATLRRDGSPRLSGIEPLFAMGELWLGMMDASLKARDLQRDPRMTLHNATVDKNVTEGDVKVSGRAVEAHDVDTKQRFADAVSAQHGEMPPGPFHLFRVDVTEVSSIRPAGDHLVTESWREGRPVRQVKRY